MIPTTRTLVRRFWGVFAFLLISLAVLVTIGRELTPYVSNYKDDLELMVEKALGVDVRIDSVEGSWQGLQPELRLRGVTLNNDAGDQIFAVNTLRSRVSLLDSLISWDLVIGKFELVQVEMSLIQQEDRTWMLSGWDPQKLQDDGIASDDPLDRFFSVNEIEFRDAELKFEFATGHHSELSLPHLLLQNSGDFHRFESQVGVDSNNEVITLVVEGHGDPRSIADFSAKGYIKLRNFELEKAMAALPGELWEGLPNKEWREGHFLDFEAWFDIYQGMEIVTRGRVDVGEPPVAMDNEVLFPNQSGANFAARWNTDGSWELSLRDILMAWGDYTAPSFDVLISSPQLGQPVTVQTAELDLDVWLPRVKEIGLVKGEALAALNDLDPKGVLENLQLRIEGAGVDAIRLQTNLNAVSVESYNGAPKLVNVDGYLEATPLAGYIDLDSKQGFSMLYPTVYEKPFELSDAIGRVHWDVDLEKRAVNVHSGLITADSKFGEVAGYFSLFVPFSFGSVPEELIIQLGVNNSQAKFQNELVPYVVPQTLRDWLDNNIHSGDVSYGGFIYRGGFTSKENLHTSLQLFVDVADGRVSYHPSWPELTDVESTVWLDDTTVYAKTQRAKTYDTKIADAFVTVDVESEGDIIIEVAGEASGTLDDAIRLLNETPLRDAAGRYFDEVQLQGDLLTQLELMLPLEIQRAQEGEGISDTRTLIDSESQEVEQGGAPEDKADAVKPEAEFRIADGAKYRIVGSLGDVSLRHDPSNITIEEIEGSFSYHESNGINSDNLTGTLWGQALSGSVSTSNFLSSSQKISILANGRTNVDNVAAWLDVDAPSFITGSSEVFADLTFSSASTTDQSQPDAVLTLQSDLSQVVINAPVPLGKMSEEVLPVKVELNFDEQGMLYSLDYGDHLRGKVLLRDNQLAQLVMSVNDQARLKGRDGWFIDGHIDALNYAEWQEFVEAVLAYWQKQPGGTGEGLYPVVNLSVGTLDFQGFPINDIVLGVTRPENKWLVNLDSTTIAGDIEIAQGEAPIELMLDYFHLVNSDANGDASESIATEVETQESIDPLAGVDPKSLPAMSVMVNQFTIDGDDFGNWTFKLTPTTTGVEVTQLVADVKNVHIDGVNQTGATIWWDKIGEQSSSRFQGVVVSKDLGKVLESWDQPAMVDSEDAVFKAQLNWGGSPANISTINIAGDVSIAMQRGAFSTDDSQSGASGALLQLISFFNVDSWLRRLRYSFSDLGREGMPYHNIEGMLNFDRGTVNIYEPLTIDSPSGRFQITGSVNLVDEGVDAMLTATLPVGGNLTLVTAFAAGLPAALGVYLISKAFEKQVDKVASLRYEVKGSLNDPELKFERVSDKKIVESIVPEISPQESDDGSAINSSPDSDESLPHELPLDASDVIDHQKGELDAESDASLRSGTEGVGDAQEALDAQRNSMYYLEAA
ncbi:YhdP family phospholipid transporter [Aurantivibrio plasticivorans]